MAPWVATWVAHYVPCGKLLRVCFLSNRVRVERKRGRRESAQYAMDDRVEFVTRSFVDSSSHVDLIVIDGQADLVEASNSLVQGPRSPSFAAISSGVFSVSYPAVGSIFSGPWRCVDGKLYNGAPIQIEFMGSPCEWEPMGMGCRLSRPIDAPARFTSKPLCALMEVAMVEQAEEQQITVRIARRTCFVASKSPDDDDALIVSRGYSSDAGGHKSTTWTLRRVRPKGEGTAADGGEHTTRLSSNNGLVDWAIGKSASAFAGEWACDGFYSGAIISIVRSAAASCALRAAPWCFAFSYLRFWMCGSYRHSLADRTLPLLVRRTRMATWRHGARKLAWTMRASTPLPSSSRWTFSTSSTQSSCRRCPTDQRTAPCNPFQRRDPSHSAATAAASSRPPFAIGHRRPMLLLAPLPKVPLAASHHLQLPSHTPPSNLARAPPSRRQPHRDQHQYQCCRCPLCGTTSARFQTKAHSPSPWATATRGTRGARAPVRTRSGSGLLSAFPHVMTLNLANLKLGTAI